MGDRCSMAGKRLPSARQAVSTRPGSWGRENSSRMWPLLRMASGTSWSIERPCMALPS